jgi:hypothetical protein
VHITESHGDTAVGRPWILGFLGFLGLLGFLAFAVHQPAMLFWFTLPVCLKSQLTLTGGSTPASPDVVRQCRFVSPSCCYAVGPLRLAAAGLPRSSFNSPQGEPVEVSPH